MSYPRQAIRTRFIGPTGSQDSRISATNGHSKIIVPWDDSKEPNENHHIAAKIFRERMGWDGQWAMGWFNGEAYHVWVGE